MRAILKRKSNEKFQDILSNIIVIIETIKASKEGGRIDTYKN